MATLGKLTAVEAKTRSVLGGTDQNSSKQSLSIREDQVIQIKPWRESRDEDHAGLALHTGHGLYIPFSWLA